MEAYQHLLERGWRRSGNYVYRPQIQDCCCPHYTIRLDVSRFAPSAAHRRVDRKLELFASGAWAARAVAQRDAGDAQRSTSAQAQAGARMQSSTEQEGERSAQVAARGGGSMRQSHDDMATAHSAHDNASNTGYAAAQCSEALRQCIQDAASESELAGCSAASAEFAAPKHIARATSNPSHMTGAAPASAVTQHTTNNSAGNGGKELQLPRTYLRCSMCWEVAARSAGNAGAFDAARRAGLPKAAAKKARKRERATQPPVASAAARLAERVVLPALQAALARHAQLAQLRPEAWAERGHLWVSLDASPIGAEDADTVGATEAVLPGKGASAEACLSATAGKSMETGLEPCGVQMAGVSGSDAAHEEAVHAGGRSAKRATRAVASDARSSSESGMVDEGSESDVGASTDTDTEREGAHHCEASHADHAAMVPSAASHAQRASSTGEPSASREQWWLQPPPDGRWPLRVVLQRSAFQEAEWRLWRRYQATVHNDKPARLTRSAYHRFLVSSPFPANGAPAAGARYVVPAWCCDGSSGVGCTSAAASNSAGVAAIAQRMARRSAAPCMDQTAPDQQRAHAALREQAGIARAHGSAASGSSHSSAGAQAGAAASGREEWLTVRPDGAPSCGYGAFHMQFWLGAHLVAVNVIDILPRCETGWAEVFQLLAGACL